MLDRKTKTRLHIRSISEASGQSDSEIAELFSEMRQATGLSLEKLAQKLNSSVATVSALESGELSALPSWNESRRVVVEYTKMLGLDPEPVLRRIMVQLPGDHPSRPRTQTCEPSYDNMRFNMSAAMNRVPGSQAPIENPSFEVAASPAGENNPIQGQGFSPDYAPMRAQPPIFPPSHTLAGGAGPKGSPQLVAKKRKGSVFVLFTQFLLLLIILGAGYAMWLSVNDPKGFEALKSLTVTGWETLVEQARVWLNL